MEILRDFRKTALIYRGEEISYAQVIENVGSFANLLSILPDERVGIVMENRPEWVYALFGTWKRGGVVVPVDFLSSPEEISYIVSDCSPRVVFCSDQTYENVKKACEGKGVEIINVDRIALPAPWEGSVKREKDDLALLPYTSGTTGEPKGVMLTFGNIWSNIRGVASVGIAGKEDKTLAILPFHHMYPLMTTLLLPVYLGATIVFLDELSPEDILEKFRRYRISFLIGVPRLYQLFHRRIMEQVRARALGRLAFWLLSRFGSEALRKRVFRRVHDAFGGNLKFMVSGGAKLPLEIAKDLTALGFRVLEGYGLTETSPIVSFNPPDRIKLGSVGVPIEGVEVMTTQEGEIVVRGENVMKGYWNKPEQTAQVLVDGWLYTGDLGFIDEEGYIFITGRKKELIVLPSGKNVFPEEIEERILKRAPFIKEVGVFERGGKLYAVVYPDLEKVKALGIANLYETIKWEVIDKVNRELPEWKRISGFRVVDTELPKTRLGKLRRFLLPEVYEGAKREVKSEREGEELFSTPEGRSLKSFLERLSNKGVSASDHLELDLGLDSLAKVELLSFIERKFGVRLSEEELARNMVVRELISLVRGKRGEGGDVSWGDILRNAPRYELEEHPFLFELGRRLLGLYFKLYHRLDVRGLENLPEPPFIIAPNHQSYLDAFAIASVLPSSVARKTFFMGEEKYFRSLPGRLFARLFHVIPVNVNRGLREALEKTARVLLEGKVVVIFPEGARTRTGELMEFKKGIGILSRELGVPIVPVAIWGAFEAWSVYDKFPKPKKIKIMFGKPVYPDGKSYEEIVAETRRWVRDMLEFLKGEG
ncbi:MAG: AMP-binding protein [Aquificae bacterium]|nr:AMP-binding protein [Aquificota bacterium]